MKFDINLFLLSNVSSDHQAIDAKNEHEHKSFHVWLDAYCVRQTGFFESLFCNEKIAY